MAMPGCLGKGGEIIKYEMGGYSPHISRRAGNVLPKGTSLAALPADYRARLIRATVELARSKKNGR
jgi:hypothetical protein